MENVRKDTLTGAIINPALVRGKSAYELALENGFEGTEAEWLESLNGRNGLNGKDGADGLTPYIKDGTWWIGDTDTGVNAQNPDNELSEDSENAVQNKIVVAELKKINGQIADILYTPITINSFTVTPSTAEIGSTVSKVALAWSLNKTPKALTLDGADQTGNGAELTNLAITANKSWTLKATDERGATAEKSVALSFLNGVYYGVSAAPSEYNSAFILGLTKNLRSSKLTSISVNAGDGQYIYYCLPKRFGTCSFTVGGFSGGFSLVATMQFENASGYTEDYYIYKSDNAGLGSTKVTIA